MDKDLKKESELREFLEMPVNIWSEIVYDLHPKIRKILDGLETDGQIDHDSHGHPFVFGCEKVGGNNWRIDVLRAGKRENIILSTRKRADPIMSFNAKDGWKRIDMPRLGVANNPNAPRPERAKRFEARTLVDKIIEST